MVPKPGVDAHVGIVKADVVYAQNRSGEPIRDLRQATSGGLTGHDRVRLSLQPSTDVRELVVFELVEDQISEDHPISVVTGKREQVVLVPGSFVRPRCRLRPEIKTVDVKAAPVKERGQFTGPCANLEHGLTSPNELGQYAHEPSIITHQSIRDAEVATVMQRVRMLRRQRIEQLGLDRTGHGRDEDARRKPDVHCTTRFP